LDEKDCNLPLLVHVDARLAMTAAKPDWHSGRFPAQEWNKR
jgi:hypothetical protein